MPFCGNEPLLGPQSLVLETICSLGRFLPFGVPRPSGVSTELAEDDAAEGVFVPWGLSFFAFFPAGNVAIEYHYCMISFLGEKTRLFALLLHARPK